MTGPDTSGPPSGPKIVPASPSPDAVAVGHAVADWLAAGKPVIDETRRRPRRPAAPLTAEQREDRYRRQTGGRVTARQRRRIAHKTNRALRPA